jgi:peptidoglycan/xylan/chitin deacetylase (PgdA/CDA1 family)
MTRYPEVVQHRRARDPDGRAIQGRIAWPDGIRCVAVLAIDFDGPSHDVGQGVAPLGARSTGRYAGRVGARRHLDMLARLGIPATFFVPGYDAECYPEVVRDIADAGHEVGAHGYLHERTPLPPDEEARRLALTHDILGMVTGRAPRGWRSPSGQKTRHTMEVLHRLGYVYDTSDKDFDLPYLIDLGEERRIVEIPNNTYSLDDHPFFHVSMTPPSEVGTLWREEFDTIHAERGFYLLSVHPRSGWGSGTPSRSRMLEDVLRHALSREGTVFMTLEQVAAHVCARPELLEEVRA